LFDFGKHLTIVLLSCLFSSLLTETYIVAENDRHSDRQNYIVAENDRQTDLKG